MKKRILYISNTRFPSERAHSAQIAHSCQGFCLAGAEVELVVNDRRESTGKNVVEHFGFKPMFKVTRVKFGLLNMPNFKPSFVINNLFFILNVAFRYDFKKFDFLYVRDHWLALFLLFFVDSEKIIYESHEAKYNFAAKKVLNANVLTVCISIGIRDYYIEKGVTDKFLFIAEDGIDESFFQKQKYSKEDTRKELGIPTSSPVVMYIGRLDEWKGYKTFCAAAELEDKYSFVIIGGPDSRVEDDKKRYRKTLFLGEKPYKDLAKNQQSADVLVIPNSARSKLASSYTSPLKLFAHMSSGVPLVLSNVESLSSIVREDEAFWFEPDSEESLVSSLNHLFNNYDKALARARFLKEKAMSYTWNKRSEKIIEWASTRN